MAQSELESISNSGDFGSRTKHQELVVTPNIQISFQ